MSIDFWFAVSIAALWIVGAYGFWWVSWPQLHGNGLSRGIASLVWPLLLPIMGLVIGVVLLLYPEFREDDLCED